MFLLFSFVYLIFTFLLEVHSKFTTFLIQHILLRIFDSQLFLQKGMGGLMPFCCFFHCNLFLNTGGCSEQVHFQLV